MLHRFSRPALSIVATALALHLGSCSVDYQPPDSTSAEVSAQLYAAEFEQARQKLPARAALAREIITDNIITEAEYTNLYEQFRQCMSDNGVPDYYVAVNDGGGHGDVSRQTYEAAESECNDRFGFTTILFIYGDIVNNPLHYDHEELKIRCLINNKILAPGTSPEDYSRAERKLYDYISTHRVDFISEREPVNYIGPQPYVWWIGHECQINPSFDRTQVPEPQWLKDEVASLENPMPDMTDPGVAPNMTEPGSTPDAGAEVEPQPVPQMPPSTGSEQPPAPSPGSN